MNNIITILIIVPVLSFVLLGLNVLLAPHKPYEDKLSIYECGFSAVPLQTRSNFPIQFYIVGLLFLIFDLEILVLYPASVTLSEINTYGFVVVMIFFVILTIGFVYELGSGAISLDKIIDNKSDK